MSGPDIIQPPGWPRPSGYAEGVAASGRTIFVSGQVGWDPATRELVGRDFAAQARRALENVLAVLRAAGAWPSDVTRMTWYITDLTLYTTARAELGAAWRELFGTHYPAMSVVQVAALLEVGALVEIEATAVTGG